MYFVLLCWKILTISFKASLDFPDKEFLCDMLFVRSVIANLYFRVSIKTEITFN